jgi:ABC-2 type transport system permease protein
VRGIPTGTISYQAFMTPGILAQSFLFGAIFYGIAVIWERDFGIVHKLLVSPASRSALVFGKTVASGFRGLVQALIIYLVALGMRIDINMSPGAIFGVTAAVVLGSATFATLSLVIACVVKTRERFMGIGQVLTVPLFFASNAIYQINLMPSWLRTTAQVSPLTYLVDALRVMMLGSSQTASGLAIDFSVLLAVFLALHIVAVRLYPTLVR